MNMNSELDSPLNKERIAIIAVGYNRKKALERLLDSVSQAHYDIDGVPLIISIDASGDFQLYEFVKQFKWNHGPKYVNIEQNRLGLKDHIFQCMSLSRFFRGVIILEDDLFVSPFFYHYAISSLDQYGDDKNVAGIALYTNEYDGITGLPIQFVKNEYDVFAWQECCTWGEMFNERMWNSFSIWLEQFDEDFSNIEMHENMKSWTRAWSKYMMAYMIQTNKSFIFPYFSVSTNFNDAGGEHGGGDSSVVQVSLLQGKMNYNMGHYEDLFHYDCYCTNKDIAKWLGLKDGEVTADIYGSRGRYTSRYVLSPSPLPYKKIGGYRLSMRPWELNIQYRLLGEDIFLYDRESNEPEYADRKIYPVSLIMYFMHRYQQILGGKWSLHYYWSKIMSKIGR